MLGCKYNSMSLPCMMSSRINRYMLGCKCFHYCIITIRIFQELIDTCWDVNSLKPSIVYPPSSELIDTCWDVNYPGKNALLIVL